MTNLVKRLREKAFRTETYEMLEAAADRIEKLEAALREIANFDLYGDYSNAYEIQPIARKALEGKDE